MKENLAQMGDALGCRATPPVPVESGYGRQQKVFCQRVITNIATYNVCMLKAKWREQELVGFLERKRIDVCAIQEDVLPGGDSNQFSNIPTQHVGSLCG